MGGSRSGKIDSHGPTKVTADANIPEKPTDFQRFFRRIKAVVDRFEVKTCRECERAFNTTKRPVQAVCGHIKCGDCFIVNDDCPQCNPQMTVKVEKPYYCRRCGQLCPSLKDLQQHMTTHAGVRPFECSACEKTFRKEVHVLRHIKMIHNQPKHVSCKHVAEDQEVEQ